MPVPSAGSRDTFLARYMRPHCDNPTAVPALNIADFACFLTKFAAGCE